MKQGQIAANYFLQLDAEANYVCHCRLQVFETIDHKGKRKITKDYLQEAEHPKPHRIHSGRV